MAGDTSLSITPVMKWNFERSCYRWLVTRHPAQFERMDFTAQILQSASRARKAFYECGWAEAKVLIRPSDGKFERTPFFDTIIRRGLRNSTRFDVSTLTEEEVEALGMHRDESLGFKLQIRQFRRRKGAGGVIPHQQQQQHQRGEDANSASRSSPPPSPSPLPHAVSPPSGRTHHPTARISSCAPRGGATAVWRAVEPAGSSPSDQHHWGRESAWRCDSGIGVGGHSSRDVVPWGGSHARPWGAGGGDDRQVELSSDAAAAPTDTSSVWGMEHAVNRRGRAGWEAPRQRVWSGMDDRKAAAWDSCTTGARKHGDFERIEPNSVGAGGGCARVVGGDHPSDDDGLSPRFRESRNRDIGGGGGRGEQNRVPRSAVEPRAPDFVRHLERVDERASRMLGAQQGRGNGDARVVGNGSPNAADAGAGALLAQGYMRLAAMRDNQGSTSSGYPVPPARRTPGRVTPVPHVHASEMSSSGSAPHLKRMAPETISTSAFSGRYLAPLCQGQAIPGGQSRPRGRSPSPRDDVAPRRKKRRESEDPKTPGEMLHGFQRGEVDGTASSGIAIKEQLTQGRERNQRGASPTCSVTKSSGDDRLDQELAESEQQLQSARRALDIARARFDEADRTHQAKREQAMAAVDQRPALAMSQTRRGCSNLHSLARSCAAAAAEDVKEVEGAAPVNATTKMTSTTTTMIATAPSSMEGKPEGRDDGRSTSRGNCGGRRRRSSDDHSENQDQSEERYDNRSCSDAADAAPAKAKTESESERAVTDELNSDVKMEAEILCGMGRAPVLSACTMRSSSPASSRSSAVCGSERRGHAAIASLAAVAAAADAAPPTPPTPRNPSPVADSPRLGGGVSPLSQSSWRSRPLAGPEHDSGVSSGSPSVVTREEGVRGGAAGDDIQKLPCYFSSFGKATDTWRDSSSTYDASAAVALAARRGRREAMGPVRVSAGSDSVTHAAPTSSPRSRQPHDAIQISDFPPTVLLTRAGTATAAVGVRGDGADREDGAESPRSLPTIVKAPRSPSASGETDSDHSDSTSGVGCAGNLGGSVEDGGRSGYYEHRHDHRRRHPSHPMMRGPEKTGSGTAASNSFSNSASSSASPSAASERFRRFHDEAGSWQQHHHHGGRHSAEGYVPPLARLAAVAAGAGIGGGAGVR